MGASEFVMVLGECLARKKDALEPCQSMVDEHRREAKEVIGL